MISVDCHHYIKTFESSKASSSIFVRITINRQKQEHDSIKYHENWFEVENLHRNENNKKD